MTLSNFQNFIYGCMQLEVMYHNSIYIIIPSEKLHWFNNDQLNLIKKYGKLIIKETKDDKGCIVTSFRNNRVYETCATFCY